MAHPADGPPSLGQVRGVKWTALPLPELPLAKVLVGAGTDGYTIVATDLVGVWHESLSGDAALLARLQRDNRNLDMPVARLLGILSEQLQSGSASLLLVAGDAAPTSRRTVELTARLVSSVALVWRFEMTPLPHAAALAWMSEQLVLPSVALAIHLDARVKALQADIARRDRDMRDMHELIKSAGIRFKPRVAPFDASSFDAEMLRTHPVRAPLRSVAASVPPLFTDAQHSALLLDAALFDRPVAALFAGSSSSSSSGGASWPWPPSAGGSEPPEQPIPSYGTLKAAAAAAASAEPASAAAAPKRALSTDAAASLPDDKKPEKSGEALIEEANKRRRLLEEQLEAERLKKAAGKKKAKGFV